MKTKRHAFSSIPATASVLFVFVMLLPFLFMGQPSQGQNAEFNIKSNGLIYGEQTIRQLRYIVDSLNLKFRTCELHKAYLAQPQTQAHYVSMQKGGLEEARRDMERHMPLETFLKKYPAAKVTRDLLVVKDSYTDYNGKEVYTFSSLELGDESRKVVRFDGQPEKFTQQVKGRWLVNYSPKAHGFPAEITAFYFPEEFKQDPLPLSYARMVQYSNCLIDTTTQIFKQVNGRPTSLYSERPAAVEQLMVYVYRETKKPEYPETEMDEKQSEAFYRKYQQWQTNLPATITSKLMHWQEFQQLLAAAVPEALTKGGSDDEFEEIVAHFHSPQVALELKRSRKVVGSCSMDDSPRVHALNIVLLSAETVHWETFLRAHLDIMNDRFERASDGSYAWAARKTYIRELEVLDINVPDLLFGISLRIGNPDQNHYFGSISRLGRALTESEQAADLEKAMLHMISDKQLDNYNRMMIYYLFLNYTYQLDDTNRQKENIVELNKAVKTLPAYLATKATVKE